MRKFYLILSIALLSFGATTMRAAENHFKFYGFIRNYFTYDSRESIAGTGDLFNYLPKDYSLNADGDDVNAQSSFRFLALTSRVGVDVTGYNVGNVHLGAKVEADFYNGLSKATAGAGLPSTTSVSGTAALRLRQAYTTITWKDLPMGEDKASVGLKIGQAWHPMGADHPQIFSLEAGAPFGPFSRTPLVQMDANLGSNWIVTAATLWQQQYTSNGPSGSVADYMKYSGIPEIYAGITYKKGGFLGRAGIDVLSIKPRVINDAKQKVSDRITTASPYENCSSLTSVEIPSSVTSIGDCAFSGCYDLTSIELPPSVTSIGNQAFYDCNSLTSIEIPSSVALIGYRAFSGCSGLTSIVVNASNTVYDSRNN